VADDDDGFGVDIQPPVRKLGPVLDRWKAMKRNPSTVRTKKDVGEGSFVTNAEIGVHDISEEYDTNELESDVDSDEGVVRDGPKFLKYRSSLGIHLRPTKGNLDYINFSFRQTQLIDCFPLIYNYCILQGLMTVFDKILNGVEHRFYLRHLYSNFKKKFGGGVVIRDLMMGAAKATFYAAWEKMGELRNTNPEAYNWLVAIPRSSWCKHAFNIYLRCDVLMNNLSESFNSTILLARDKPIISIMEWIRSYTMSRFATLREKLNAYSSNVMPKPKKKA